MKDSLKINKMYLDWKIILLLFLSLLLGYSITLLKWPFTLSKMGEYSNIISSNPSLLDYLEGASDSRVRLSKLIGESVLGPISMWVAFPSSDKVAPGTTWYNQLWDEHGFGGYKHVDDMISLSPCKNYNQVFIQIGAHLGIFPLVAAYRGCRAIAVEPIPAAHNFTRISAKINNWQEDKFIAINALGSSKNGEFMWFDPTGISLLNNPGSSTGKIRIPTTTLDALNDKYGYIQKRSQSIISFVIIDVEEFEQEVLLGAKRLIEERSVLVYQIEVWTQIPSTGLVKSFPGLQLLIDNKYRLYTISLNTQLNFKRCDEFTDRLMDIPTIFNETCRKSLLPNNQCLGEVFAVRSDLPPLRQWLSACPK